MSGYLDTVAAGHLLGVGGDYVRVLARSGKLRAFRAGRKWLFLEEDIRAFMRNENREVVPYEPSRKAK